MAKTEGKSTRNQILFTVRLNGSDWEADFNRWRCSVLRIPGVEVKQVNHYDGKRSTQLTREQYTADDIGGFIRWINPDENPPPAVPNIALELRITKAVSIRRDLEIWRYSAIIAAIIAATATVVAAGLQSNSPPVIAFINKIFGTDNSQIVLPSESSDPSGRTSRPESIFPDDKVNGSPPIDIPPNNLPSPEPPEVEPTDNALTEEDALSLVNEWLNARSQILGPPYRKSELEKVAHSDGCLYSDLMSDNTGSISYLEDGGHYYKYEPYELEEWAIATTNNPPYITAEVKGAYTYYDSQGGIDIGDPSQRLAFIFKKEENDWKIDNYVKMEDFDDFLEENQDFNIESSNLPCL